MLAIVSDLHFCDGTATEKNVDPKAFALALGDIYAEAAGLAAQQQGHAHLDVVMLGDVFDLLRTEAWFAVPPSERPWGSAAALGNAPAAAATIGHARRIMSRITEENAAALALLRGETLAPPPGVSVRRILLPGNHDRLALHDDGLYAAMRAAVRADDERTLAAEGIFPHRLEMPQYGLLARHGHEWDAWNFESYRQDAAHPTADYEDAAYLPAPIGDPITTELAARLPFEMKLRLDAIGSLGAEDKDHIYRRLQRVEDVRPLFASIPWVYREAARLQSVNGGATGSAVEAALEDALRTVIADFRALDFFDAWYAKHNSWHPFNGARKLKAALAVLSDVTINTVEHVGPAFEALFGGDGKEPCTVGAAAERLDHLGAEGMRFVVYGHTHDAVQVALAAADGASSSYLNSGTFRQRVFRSEDRRGFVSSDYLTYLCFFTEAEARTWRDPRDRLVGPAYSAWTGMRNR